MTEKTSAQPTGKELLDEALQKYVDAFALSVRASGGRMNVAEAVAQGRVTTLEVAAIRDELDELLGEGFADRVKRRIAAKLDEGRRTLPVLLDAPLAAGPAVRGQH